MTDIRHIRIEQGRVDRATARNDQPSRQMESRRITDVTADATASVIVNDGTYLHRDDLADMIEAALATEDESTPRGRSHKSILDTLAEIIRTRGG